MVPKLLGKPVRRMKRQGAIMDYTAASEGIASASASRPFKIQKHSSSSSSSSISRSTTTIEDLKEDEMVEILVRLPLECVFRCKSVSKYWLALLSDPTFIRSYTRRRRHQTNLLPHFIVFHCCMCSLHSSEFDFYGHLPLHLPLPDDDNNNNNNNNKYPTIISGKSLDFSFSFIRQQQPPLFRDCLEIVSISHGLVLCFEQVRLLRSTTPKDPPPSYYVCNPLTKQWLNISSPGDYYCPPYSRLDSRKGFNVGQVGFMCFAPDPQLPHQVEFLVLEVHCKEPEDEDEFRLNEDCILVSKDDPSLFYTRVFSSLTGRWSTYQVASCPSESTWLPGSGHRYNYGKVLVYQRKFHWSATSCLIAYDPLNQPHICTSIPFPVRLEQGYNNDSSRRVELSEGYIRLATYSPDYYSSQGIGTYSVFQLSDYDKGKWDLKYAIRIPRYMLGGSFCSPTNGDIMCVIHYHHHDTTNTFQFVDLKTGGSILTDLDHLRISQYPHLTCSPFFANFFVMTAWPTKIPQLPY